VGKINVTVSVYYKGRSINKLQNGAVAWIFKISKNAKYTLCRKFILGHPVRICKQWRYCGIVSRWLIWQRCCLSSHMEQRARSFFCGLKDILQMLFTEKCVQCMVTNGPMKKTLGGQKFASDRGSMGRSSVACTADDIVFCIGHSQTCWKMGQMFK